MHSIKLLQEEVNKARNDFIHFIKQFAHNQGNYKPSAQVWSLAEITEHLVYAEYGGICGMYLALNKYRNREKTWEGENPNENLTIEEIIDRTWKRAETAPDPAVPRMGLAIELWISALEANRSVLEKLTEKLQGLNYDEIIQPHPISGPLNVWQRYQFLRFHIQRHLKQAERLSNHPEFPKNTSHHITA